MKFLTPLSNSPVLFGTLTTPGHGLAGGIVAGGIWAADNQVFSGKFDAEKFTSWLKRLEPYRNKCLFVVCPDVVGNAQKTIELFNEYADSFSGWPLAFVAQDGQEGLDFPDSDKWSTLFIGGSSIWKMSHAATICVKRAQKLGKHIHIGRVNWFRRYQHFASLDGSEEFTCDGTRTRFGKNLALKDWEKYQNAPKQYSFYS